MDDTHIQKLTQAVFSHIFIPLEASARHVHLTAEQIQTLFGGELLPLRPLSQPGQYLSNRRLTVIGPKGRLENVAVLGPARKEAQVEISITDSRTLGLDAPIRCSGDTQGTPGIILEGPNGRIGLQEGLIIAKRHLHLTPDDASRFGVTDNQSVQLQTYTERPLLFQDVVVRVSERFATAAHLDFDEANACAMRPGDWGRIIL